MFTKIRKRNGTEIAFDAVKITDAIAKAGEATKEFDLIIAEKLTTKVIEIAMNSKKDIPTIEEIQDIVEKVLLDSPYKSTAKSYILYRNQHADMRKMRDKTDVFLIDSYLKCLDWQVKENSNMSYSLQGLNNYISSEVSKTYWLQKIYPKEIGEAHLNGNFHIHDLQEIAVYCVGWDLKDVLLSGFKGAEGKIESAPAKHLRTALGQVVNLFYTLQGESAGAQAFSNFDTLLAPFIRYDNLSYPEIKQAMQEFLFNLNVPTRVGFQTPFTNLTLDLKVPSQHLKEPVIIGGKLQKETYGEFQTEMNLLNKAFLEVLSEGDARGRVFTFPIPTYNMSKDFDWDDPELEYLWKIAARYGIPYFANFVNSDMSPEDVRSMCCRLRLDTRKLNYKGGGLFGANPLTGSLGVVTINMPRIGYESSTEEEFFAKLDDIMDLAKKSLEIKRKVMEQMTDKNLFPYSKYYLRHVKGRFKEYWFNHFSTIGIVGMNEACLNFLNVDIGEKKGQEFSMRVLNHMRKRLQVYQEETGHNYNLEATPAEGAGYRLALMDRDKYPDIITANDPSITEEPFYTNSTQLPVNYTNDIFELLDHQDSLQVLYTGGTVAHVFVGEEIMDCSSVKSFVRKVCENYHLPYFTITPTFSICPSHGYLSGRHHDCPTCGRESEVYSRVVGYLSPLARWNNGKRGEFDQRKTFSVEKSKVYAE